MTRSIWIFLWLFPLILFTGCKGDIFHSGLSEGEIEYEVTYPEMDPSNVMADFMPDKMTMRFKDNKFVTELSAGMGMFKTNFISNSNDYTLNHMVKLINKKYATQYDKDGVVQINGEYPDYEVIHLPGTKMIAGYECKRALIIFTNVSKSDFYIYYTDEIDIDDPNWGIPFGIIDGVLMEYRMERNGIVMRFEATKVEKKDIEDDIFEMPEEYELITHAEMQKELNDIFESFNY